MKELDMAIVVLKEMYGLLEREEDVALKFAITTMEAVRDAEMPDKVEVPEQVTNEGYVKCAETGIDKAVAVTVNATIDAVRPLIATKNLEIHSCRDKIAKLLKEEKDLATVRCKRYDELEAENKEWKKGITFQGDKATRLEQENKELREEKSIRLKYQDIVYRICCLFDKKHDICLHGEVFDKVKALIKEAR